MIDQTGVSAPLEIHFFSAVGGDFPITCKLCACFRDSANHFPFEDSLDDFYVWLRSMEGQPVLHKHIEGILGYLEVRRNRAIAAGMQAAGL